MKILLIKNNITDNKTVDTGIEQVKYYLSTIGITAQIDIKISNKQFTTESFDNLAIGRGYQVKPSEILDEVTGVYDFAFLIFDNTKVGTPVPLNPTQSPISRNGCVPMQMCHQWFFTFPEVFSAYFLHELCHGQFFKYGGNDITHNQQAYPEWSNKQQYEYYLSILKTFPKTTYKAPQAPTERVCTITRYYGDKQTTGTLLAINRDKTFTAKTLERKWLNNAPNISCIPEGTYNVVWSFSPKFMRYTYQVLNVKNRSGIRLHYGNFAWKPFGKPDIEGCILLGDKFYDINKDGSPEVINSRKTIDLFEKFMHKKPFVLTIINGNSR